MTVMETIGFETKKFALPVAGADLFYDFTDGSKITLNGNTISALTDKGSIGANASQGTAAAQPTWGVTFLNGRPVADFDGGDWLETSTTANIAAATFFAVAKATTFAAVRSLWGSDTNAAGVRLRIATTGKPDLVVAGTTSTSDNALSTATWYVLTATFSDAGDASAFWTNTTANGTPANAGAPNAALVRLGAGAAGAGTHLGSIAMLIRYPSVLSAGNLLSVQNALGQWFGLF